MDQLYKQIVSFQRRCNDYIDDPSHHLSNALKQDVQKLEDDAQTRKNAYTLESRVRQVINLLEKCGEEAVISHHHADELIDTCEEFMRELKQLR